MPKPYRPAAIDNPADYAADCDRLALQLTKKARKATDWTERDRLLNAAASLAAVAEFWRKESKD